jgi:hypothetical protein
MRTEPLQSLVLVETPLRGAQRNSSLTSRSEVILGFAAKRILGES